MSLDVDLLYTELRNIVITRIGNELATISGQPAVIQARSGVSKKYPYVTMDILNISDSNSYLTNTVSLEDGSISYETHKEVPFIFQVRALDGDSYRLCNKLRKCFNFETYLNQFYTATQATVKEVSNITPITDPLSTQITEFCTFTVTVTVNDTEIDDQLGYATFVETPSEA